jgi:serine/threonine protein kinase
VRIEPGQKIGPYRVVERVGKGGMASVYKARQTSLARFVAIKVLPEHLLQEPGFFDRFFQEAIAVASLRHPHIPVVFDHGEEEGIVYIVSEFIDGGTLADQMGRPLPLEYVVEVLAPVASALDYAHARGVLHRDVKPTNILLTRDGKPMLNDFGLAKIVTARGGGITQAGMILGTPEYMAPEQCSSVQVTPATDEYSLAIVAYEMLTGKVPFSAATPAAILIAQIRDEFKPPTSINPDIPSAVEEALRRALAKTPADRFPSCARFVRALAASVGGTMPPGVSAERREEPREPLSTSLVGANSAELPSTVVAAAAPEPSPPAAGASQPPVPTVEASDRWQTSLMDAPPRTEAAEPPQLTAVTQTEPVTPATTVTEVVGPPPGPSQSNATRQLEPAQVVPPAAVPGAAKTGARRRGGWHARLLVAGAALLVLGSFGGVVLHQRSTGGQPAGAPTSVPGGGQTSGQTSVSTAPFPDPAEQALLALFPQALVNPQGCHRYAKHYPLAIAEVECPASNAHPGAASVVYQQFDSYKQLEVHYHHVLALDIQSELGPSRQLSQAPQAPCIAGAGYFAASKYHETGQLQDPTSSPNAEGHLFCYDGSGGVPKLAWTNTNWLIVAQAVGVGTGPDAETSLLAWWQFAGPVGVFSAPAADATPEAQVRYLYERYLSREPEDLAQNTAHFAPEIQQKGFASVANEFARSQEASALVGGATKVLH